MLRIYANQWHVYAGLAVPNPSALTQINQFSKSVTELFKLVKRADKKGLRVRIYGARVVSTAHTMAAPATGRRGIRFSCPRIS